MRMLVTYQLEQPLSDVHIRGSLLLHEIVLKILGDIIVQGQHYAVHQHKWQ